MSAFVLYRPADQSGAVRWTGSAMVVAALHAALLVAGIVWYTQRPPAGQPSASVLIDMAPVPAAPEPSRVDVAPGPDMDRSDGPPPEPTNLAAATQDIAPAPLQDAPAAEAPAEPAPPPAAPEPQPATMLPEPPRPVRSKPTALRAHAKMPSELPPAPRTSAAPRAERVARLEAGPTPGAADAEAALIDYRARLSAHLKRFQHYPEAARAAGQKGTPILNFTINRSGQVLASRLASSSGHPLLDAETMALIRRAQPLPPFPPGLSQASMNFTQAIRFSGY